MKAHLSAHLKSAHVFTTEHSSAIKSLELDTLLDITNAINGQMDEATLLRIYLFTLVANFKIEKLCVVEIKNNNPNKILLKHHISTQLDLYLQDFSWDSPDASLFFPEKTSELGASGIDVVFKIQSQGIHQGFVCIGGINNRQESWLEEKVKFIQTITNILFVAIQNHRLTKQRIAQEALKKELETARHIQSLLFPKNIPCTEKIKIEATYLPHSTVGGDYFDVISISENNYILCIADVSGKGMSAALIMSNFQAALRILARQGFSLTKIVHELNQQVFASAGGEKFVTAVFIEIDTQTKTLQYINAGHNPPLMFYNKTQHFATLDKGSVMLGAFNRLPFVDLDTLICDDKVMLFAYTDGLVESIDPNMNVDKALRTIQTILLKHAFSDNLHAQINKCIEVNDSIVDDITFLSCQLS